LKTLAAAAALALAGTLPAAAQGKLASQVQAFTVDGIHVILSPADNSLVSVIVGIEGGLADGITANPALATFTSDLVTSSGSASYPKDAFRKIISQTSTSLIGGGDYRGTNYNMTATLPNFDKAWDVLSSVIMAPAFDELEYRNIMQRRVADVRRRWINPDSYAFIVADSLAKLNNPVLGRATKEDDVAAVTIPMMKDYLAKITERSRMLVVVVGNVAPADIKKKLEAFSKLPLGSYKPAKIPALATAPEPKVEMVDRPNSPTTYVYGVFAGPRAEERDYWTMQVGLRYLSENLFQEIRTKRNLSYAPASYLTSTLGQSRGVLSVSSTRPDSSVAIMKAELEKVRKGDFDEEGLNKAKQIFITNYYMQQMTNGGVAAALFNAERNTGDWQRAFSIDAISAVNKAMVKEAFEKYARNLQFGIVGPTKAVTQQKYIFRD
jgi:zinc protease